MKKRIHIYSKYERFWHWLQAILVILLAITGFEIHSSIHIFGFEKAHFYHIKLAWALITLVIFTIFWHFTTGAWRQYIPTFENINSIIRFYIYGIFKNEPHPFKKTELSKLNPLQRWTYLILKIIVFPLQIGTGLLYLYFKEWNINISLKTIGVLHTIGAFAFILFLIIHLYLTTTGPKIYTYIKAMITGWEEIEEEKETNTT